MASTVNLWMSVRFGQLEVNFSADDVSSYAPDVAADMSLHLVRAFTEAIAELRGHGVIGMGVDDDDDEDDQDDEEAPEGDDT